MCVFVRARLLRRISFANLHTSHTHFIKFIFFLISRFPALRTHLLTPRIKRLSTYSSVTIARVKILLIAHVIFEEII